MWQLSCAQLMELDAIVTAKDEEIAALKEQLRTSSHASLSPHNSNSYDEDVSQCMWVEVLCHVKGEPHL